MPASAESHFPACTFTLSSALPHGLLPSVNSGLCYCSCFLHEARPNPIAAGLPLPCAPRESTSHLGAGCLSTHLSPIDLGAWPGAFSDRGSLLSDWGRGGPGVTQARHRDLNIRTHVMNLRRAISFSISLTNLKKITMAMETIQRVFGAIFGLGIIETHSPGGRQGGGEQAPRYWWSWHCLITAQMQGNLTVLGATSSPRADTTKSLSGPEAALVRCGCQPRAGQAPAEH